MKPLIKWTGGKYREIKILEPFFPKKYRFYIEPFFGGGALFFHLQPSKAFINDISAELMCFYKYLKEQNSKFKSELEKIASFWDFFPITTLIESIYPYFSKAYYKTEILNKKPIKFFVEKTTKNSQLVEIIMISIENKLQRLLAILKKEKKFFKEDELKQHLETAIRSGIYSYYRKKLNSFPKKFCSEKKIAIWWFIRELCYGSMFRFSKNGFNIPYGGISYNRKKLLPKVEYLFQEKVTSLLKRTEIFCMDFEEFLKKVNPSKEDFIFLDPPYDTNFKDYNGITFSQSDHIRLANLLGKLSAKWLLVIKKTDFIIKLYNNLENIYIFSYKKTYSYNVRGRNSRVTEHLIITNYFPFSQKQKDINKFNFLYKEKI